MNWKFVVYLVLGLGLVGTATKLYTQWQHDREARVVAELALAGQKQLNDSTVARLAFAIASKDSLQGVVTAAKELNGKLIAGMKILVVARDTLLVHDTLVTTTAIDGTREATFKDSTFAGTIAGTITAPPYPSALGISYRIDRPAFTPEVGFVQVGDHYVATVVWQGEHAQVIAPFVLPRPKPRRIVGAYIEGDKVLGTSEVFVQAGGILRGPWGIVGVAGVQQSVFGKQLGGTRVLVGVRKEF